MRQHLGVLLKSLSHLHPLGPERQAVLCGGVHTPQGKIPCDVTESTRPSLLSVALCSSLVRIALQLCLSRQELLDPLAETYSRPHQDYVSIIRRCRLIGSVRPSAGALRNSAPPNQQELACAQVGSVRGDLCSASWSRICDRNQDLVAGKGSKELRRWSSKNPHKP